MRAKRLLGLLLVWQLVLPTAAAAGPVFDFPFPFTFTRTAWWRHSVGPERRVNLTPLASGERVRWRVEFLRGDWKQFATDEGELALDGAPQECQRLGFSIPVLDQSWRQHRVGRFAPLRERGVVIQRLADANDVRVAEGFREVREHPLAPDPGARTRIEAEPPAPECEGLLLPIRDGKRVELRAIGPDGAEWGRVTADPGFPVEPLFFAKAAVTVPADVVVLAALPVVVGFFWLVASLE